jgi:hypothetical protein
MKWTFSFCLILIYMCSYSQRAADSTAIKKLLEKGSATYRSGDAKGYADCWKVQPYGTIIISTDDGKAFSFTAEEMAKPSEYMGKGGFATMNNFKMGIYSNSAWVSFDEISTAKDGTKSYSYEMWMLEKINEEWKLVGASMHFYKQ